MLKERLTTEEKTQRILRKRRQRVVGSFRLEGIRLEASTAQSAENPQSTSTVEAKIQRLIARHVR